MGLTLFALAHSHSGAHEQGGCTHGRHIHHQLAGGGSLRGDSGRAALGGIGIGLYVQFHRAGGVKEHLSG